MTGLTPVSVSHHQFQVLAGGDPDDFLGLYVVGDDLVQVTGQSQLSVLTGPYNGPVGVRVVVHPAAPDDPLDGWEAAAEATLWCPDGRFSICGLLADPVAPLRSIATGGQGLLRVRVLARHRRPASAAAPVPMEQYHVSVWPVNADTGVTTLRVDGLRIAEWQPKPGRAAAWGMLRLVALANPDPRHAALRNITRKLRGEPDEPAPPRVAVRRTRPMPAGQAQQVLGRLGECLGATADGDELVLPAGRVEIRMRPAVAPDHVILQWRWAPRPGSQLAVPDAATSTVQIHALRRAGGDTADLVVEHRGVRGPDAGLLGLVWDYLLVRCEVIVAAGGGVPPLPWERLFAELATKPAAPLAVARSSGGKVNLQTRGGPPPGHRPPALPDHTLRLGRLDPPLLTALTGAPPAMQRTIARWAARQACAAAGLGHIDWVADALAALDRGEPLPASFADSDAALLRLQADQRVPSTAVTLATGTDSPSRQAVALLALRTAAHDSPVVSVVDTVYLAASAHGEHHRDLLAGAAAKLAALGHIE
jgi:hypothetical protein